MKYSGGVVFVCVNSINHIFKKSIIENIHSVISNDMRPLFVCQAVFINKVFEQCCIKLIKFVTLGSPDPYFKIVILQSVFLINLQCKLKQMKSMFCWIPGLTIKFDFFNQSLHELMRAHRARSWCKGYIDTPLNKKYPNRANPWIVKLLRCAWMVS